MEPGFRRPPRGVGKERPAFFTVAQAGAALRADLNPRRWRADRRADFDVDALIEERLRLARCPQQQHHFPPEGLRSAAGWGEDLGRASTKRTGEPANPRFEKYNDKDRLKEYCAGQPRKLDVPKERCRVHRCRCRHRRAPQARCTAGRAGRQGSVKAMLSLDEKLEAAGVSVADRHGLLYGVVSSAVRRLGIAGGRATSRRREAPRRRESRRDRGDVDERAKALHRPEGQAWQAKTPKAAKAKAKGCAGADTTVMARRVGSP